MRTWRDYLRPADDSYYETRFDYLSQGDILLDAPLLQINDRLELEGSAAEGFVAAVPLLSVTAMIVSPTCDFRRPAAEYLLAHPEENPYQLRQQLVVARVHSLDEWERGQASQGRAERVAQLKRYDNQRQYMYLPPAAPLPESMVDLGTVWTLPIAIAASLTRLTQLAEAAAQQLQYKLVMNATAGAIDRDALKPPLD